MSSIKISPKHGVNPTIPLCFFCGKQKNEIALMGKMKGDIEAPKNLVLDYEPCEHCKEEWSKGVALIELSQVPPQKGMPHVRVVEGVPMYPTSRVLVITESAARGIFNMPDLKKGDVLNVEEGVIQQLLDNIRK